MLINVYSLNQTFMFTQVQLYFEILYLRSERKRCGFKKYSSPILREKVLYLFPIPSPSRGF